MLNWIVMKWFTVPWFTIKWRQTTHRLIVLLLLSVRGFCRKAYFHYVLPTLALIQHGCGNRLAVARFLLSSPTTIFRRATVLFGSWQQFHAPNNWKIFWLFLTDWLPWLCDPELIERKRHALRQLWMIYGPDCFIYDVQKLFLSFAGETAERAAPESTLTYGRLYSMATKINQIKTTERTVADVFILGCSSRVLSDPSGFLVRYQENNDFRSAYEQALCACSRGIAESMEKALGCKQLVLQLSPRR